MGAATAAWRLAAAMVVRPPAAAMAVHRPAAASRPPSRSRAPARGQGRRRPAARRRPGEGRARPRLGSAVPATATGPGRRWRHTAGGRPKSRHPFAWRSLARPAPHPRHGDELSPLDPRCEARVEGRRQAGVRIPSVPDREPRRRAVPWPVAMGRHCPAWRKTGSARGARRRGRKHDRALAGAIVPGCGRDQGIRTQCLGGAGLASRACPSSQFPADAGGWQSARNKGQGRAHRDWKSLATASGAAGGACFALGQP